jgi:DNA modification methylase
MADYLLAFRRHPVDGESVVPVTAGIERFDHYIGMNPPDAGAIAMDLGIDVPGRIDGRWPKHNPFPHGSEAYRLWSIEVWQKYASPVWFDISQTRVLNMRAARAEDDEKHICPLQLDLIERALHLWSNPGEVVLSPFAGIGSEGLGAIRYNRRFIGVELKEEYWRTACKFLAEEEKALTSQMKLAI